MKLLFKCSVVAICFSIITTTINNRYIENTIKYTELVNSNSEINLHSILNLSQDEFVTIFVPEFGFLTGRILNVDKIQGTSVRIIGEIFEKNAGFGFHFNVNGIAAGAVVLRDEEKTYTLTFDEQTNTYKFHVDPIFNSKKI